MQFRKTLFILLPLVLAACGGNPTIPNDEQPLPPPPADQRKSGSLLIERLWSAGVPSAGSDLSAFSLGVDGDRICVAGANGKVECVDPFDGRTLWKRDLNVTLTTGAGLGAGLVLVGTADGVVVALNELDGQSLWSTEIDGELLSPPQALSGVVVVRTGDGRLVGLSAATGERQWSHDQTVPPLTLRGTGQPVFNGIGPSARVIAGFDNGKVVALQLSDGRQLWEAIVARPSGRTDIERIVDVDGTPLIVNNNLYVTATNSRSLALALESGQEIWELDIGSHQGLGGGDDYLFVLGDDARVTALDNRSGTKLWEVAQFSDEALTASTWHEGVGVVVGLEGNIYWLNAEDGALLARKRAGGPVRAAPIVVDARMFVLTTDGNLTAWGRAPSGE